MRLRFYVFRTSWVFAARSSVDLARLGAGGRNGFTDEEAQAMRRENAYLKRRCAQLGGDVADLAGRLLRTRQQLERMSTGRPDGRSPIEDARA